MSWQLRMGHGTLWLGAVALAVGCSESPEQQMSFPPLDSGLPDVGMSLPDTAAEAAVLPATIQAEQLALGKFAATALQFDGSVITWGMLSDVAPEPGDRYAVLAAGPVNLCGIRVKDETLRCWGADAFDGADGIEPATRYVQIGVAVNHGCGVLEDGTVECWGRDIQGSGTPPSGVYASVAVGQQTSCALDAGGAAACWGANISGEGSPPDTARFAAIDMAREYGCGLLLDGGLLCWGVEHAGMLQAPSGNDFVSVTVGQSHACALRADGTAACWGAPFLGATDVPLGETFSAIEAAEQGDYSCGIRSGDSTVICWGENAEGQLEVPSAL